MNSIATTDGLYPKQQVHCCCFALQSSKRYDKQEAKSTLDAFPAELGQPDGVTMDNGYFSVSNIEATEECGTEPDIATGRGAHYKRVDDLLQNLPDKPTAGANPKEKMAYKFATYMAKQSIA